MLRQRISFEVEKSVLLESVGTPESDLGNRLRRLIVNKRSRVNKATHSSRPNDSKHACSWATRENTLKRTACRSAARVADFRHVPRRPVADPAADAHAVRRQQCLGRAGAPHGRG